MSNVAMMGALVYHGPDVKAWEQVPKPLLVDDTDAIVRVVHHGVWLVPILP